MDNFAICAFPDLTPYLTVNTSQYTKWNLKEKIAQSNINHGSMWKPWKGQPHQVWINNLEIKYLEL